MAIQVGSVACLKASNTAGGAGVYTNIAQLKDIGADATVENIDSTTLGSTCGTATAWTTTIDGIQGATYTANGFWDDYGDTTGQAVIMDNAVKDSETWFMYYFGDADAGHYMKSRVEVESLEITANPDSTVDISVSAKSTGTITFA